LRTSDYPESPLRISEERPLADPSRVVLRPFHLGCALLDRDDPSKVVARSKVPVLIAEDDDRSGYVPNAVYTCGAILTGEDLLVSYGISDSAIGFATRSAGQIMKIME